MECNDAFTQSGETTMFRKFAIAAAAIAALGTVSLSASTPAAAWGKGGFHHFHGGHFYGGGLRVYSGYDSCLRNRWVVNRAGDLVLRTVNVCY
jgi:hypothetical protein